MFLLSVWLFKTNDDLKITVLMTL